MSEELGCLVHKNLPFSNQLLTGSMRIWMMGFTDQAPVQATLCQTFEAAAIPKAINALANMMIIITTNTSSLIDIRSSQCTYVSTDEINLVNAVAAFQKCEIEHALARFALWLPPSACRVVTRPAIELAKYFGVGGLNLKAIPDHQGDTQKYYRHHSTVTASRQVLHLS